MNELKILLKKDLLLTFGMLINLKARMRDKKLRRRTLGGLLGFVVIILYIVLFINVFLQMTPYLFARGAGGFLLELGFGAFSFMMILIALSTILSQCYFSHDIHILLRLPINQRNILLSKLLAAYAGALPMGLLLALPFIIQYGRYSGQGVLFYVNAVLSLLGSGLITVGVLAIIIIPLMGLFNRLPRFKNLFQMIGLVLFLAVFMSIQLMSKNFGMNMSDHPRDVAPGLNLSILWLFPQVKLLKSLLTTSGDFLGLGGALLILVVGGLLLFLCIRLLSGNFIRGVLAGSHVARRKKAGKWVAAKKSGIAGMIARKDIRDIFKTPIYLFNLSTLGIIFTIVILFSLFQDGMAEKLSMVGLYLTSLSSWLLILIGLHIGLLLALFFTGLGQTALTSVTREGKNIWLMQTLPIRAEDQVRGRLQAAWFFQLINILPVSALFIYMSFRAWQMIIGYLIGVLISMLMTSTSALLLGTLFPKLFWTTPSQAIKQNLLAFLHSLIIMVMSGALVALPFIIIKKRYIYGTNLLTEILSLLKVFPLLTAAIFLLIAIGCYFGSIAAWKKKIGKYQI
ncbi:MAG: hypothetical protein Q4Q07_09355 [Tissierellia bacterium]|nr:hypothetical protein [Tissierellia bacterium]